MRSGGGWSRRGLLLLRGHFLGWFSGMSLAGFELGKRFVVER
jgi:hypothetical protein